MYLFQNRNRRPLLPVCGLLGSASILCFHLCCTIMPLSLKPNKQTRTSCCVHLCPLGFMSLLSHSLPGMLLPMPPAQIHILSKLCLTLT